MKRTLGLAAIACGVMVVIAGGVLLWTQHRNSDLDQWQAETAKNLARAAALEDEYQQEQALLREQEKAALVAEQQAEIQARWDATAAEKRKQEAWLEWYEPPEKCAPKYGQLDVECVSLRRQARQSFETHWRQMLVEESNLPENPELIP